MRARYPDAAADRERDDLVDRARFSVICAAFGACTLPFAWHSPTLPELAALIGIGFIGGISHIFLTESYRYASASTVAPFDYVAMLWAFLFGYAFSARSRPRTCSSAPPSSPAAACS
jgi:drug/metabolite transporter (DMT)-like permease